MSYVVFDNGTEATRGYGCDVGTDVGADVSTVEVALPEGHSGMKVWSCLLGKS